MIYVSSLTDNNNKNNYLNQHPNRSTTTIPQKPVPEIEWNQKDITAYTDIGLQPPSETCMFQKRFLNLVDIRQGPIERTVTHIVRQKAPDYLSVKDTDNQKKPERKEYLIYSERWTGKDIRGVPINPADNWEGVWTKRFTRPVVNQQTGEVSYMELDPGKTQKIYTIPFSKKKVDEIIANSANSDKDTIIYTIKFASEDSPMGPVMPSRNRFDYEKFVWDWAQIYKFHTQPPVDAWVNYYQKKGLGNNSLAFEPT